MSDLYFGYFDVLFLAVMITLVLVVTKFIMASSSSEPPHTGQKAPISMKLVMAGIRKKYPSVKHVSTTDLHSKMDKIQPTENSPNLMLLDVRYVDEFEVSCLSNAVWIDEKLPTKEKLCEVEEKLLEKQNTDVYVYCSVGYRSSDLISQITKSPSYEKFSKQNINFYNITGGIFQWANEKRQVFNKDGNKADLVHPYNAFFGKLLNKSYRFKPKKPL
ncbi:uncharacterized protein LOC120337911 [Styela clava]